MEHARTGHPGGQHSSHQAGNYKRLAIELAIDAVIMFFAMYSMIASGAHLYLNTNNLYMTLLMVAPMALVMMAFMRPMYPDKKLNWAVCAFFIVLFLASGYGMRTQAGVGDRQFLRAMIPHHSGALLMCREARLADPEIIALCQGIAEGQQREIDQMQAILSRLK